MTEEQLANRLNHGRLRQARQAARLTQQQLARQIGVDQSYISYLEKQDRGVGFDVLQRLAHALGVSIAYLAGQVGEPTPAPYQTENSLEVIRARYDLPQGLRQLAAAGELLELLRITPEEWRALLGLAIHWSKAHLVKQDGWIQLLFSLRAVG